MGIRYQISKLGQPLSRRSQVLAWFWIWDSGLSLFKLDAHVDATVEMGSKVVRTWYEEFSKGLNV
jgi:hypothetical protein